MNRKNKINVVKIARSVSREVNRLPPGKVVKSKKQYDRTENKKEVRRKINEEIEETF